MTRDEKAFIDRRFSEEFRKILMLPPVLLGIVAYYSLLFFLAFWLTTTPYSLLFSFFSVGYAAVFLWFFYVIKIWPKVRSVGRRLIWLNVFLVIAGLSFGSAIAVSWIFADDRAISVMTIIIAGILGTAAYIFGFKRSSFAMFCSSWALPGIILVFLFKGGIFYYFLGTLFSGGILSFIFLNHIEFKRQKEFFLTQYNLKNSNEELARKDTLLQQELDFASQMQIAILPPGNHRAGNYSFLSSYFPLGKVSGDYYDIIGKDNCIFVIMADASGHGVPAAILSIVAKNIFSKIVSEELSPAEILRRANEDMVRMIKTQDYMTVFLLKLFPDGKVVYCNGAHPPAVLVSASGTQVSRLDSDGFMIGAMSNVDELYENKETFMDKNDRIFLYTDGLTETFRDDLTHFSLTRVESIIKDNPGKSSEEINREIFLQLLRFKGPREFKDDITFMMIEKID